MAQEPQVSDNQDEREARRRPWFLLPWILLVFLILFCCGQVALLTALPAEGGDTRSNLRADYAPWAWLPMAPLDPRFLLEAAEGLGLPPIATAVACLLPGNSCDTPTPTGMAATATLGPGTPGPGTGTPTVTTTPWVPTNTPTSEPPTITPTVTNTPTVTRTPTQTPTPTPLVYPVKLASPSSIPPGATSVDFTIMVINYGNSTGAQLTRVLDTLPPQMVPRAGSCSPLGCSMGGSTVEWNGVWAIPQGSFLTFRFTADVAGTVGGEVLVNWVQAEGSNFTLAINNRRVTVQTPTPTATPVSLPVANDDGPYSGVEDAVLSVGAPGLLANDSDPNGDPLAVQPVPVSGPSRGAVVLNANGAFSYTPVADYFGADSFVYRACDNTLPIPLCDTATVTILLAAVNDVPAAVNDSFSVFEDTPTILNILANDTGLGDQPLGVSLVGLPSSGSAVVVGSPGTPATIRIQYTSTLNYNGGASLTYRVCDPGDPNLGDGLLGTPDDECSTATVSIQVLPVNDRPVAETDSGYVVIEDQTLDTALLPGPPPPNRSVLTNDTDADCAFPTGDCNPTLAGVNPLTPWPVGSFGVGAWATNGSLQIRADGTFVYVPRPNFFGTDSFSYWAFDGSLYSLSSTTVNITVLPDPADSPDANPDSFTIFEDTPTQLDVLANDTGWFDIPLTLELGTLPANGTAVVQYVNNAVVPPVIRILYTPAANWSGNDSFTYCVRDVDGQPNNPCQPGDFATVSVQVLPVHDPPSTLADSYAMVEDSPATDLLPSVLANDLAGDAPIAPATVCIVGRPCPIPGFPVLVPNGRITAINPATGVIRFIPNDDFYGLVSFDYTVEDTMGARSAAATVTITVAPQNDTPVAVDDQGQTILGTPTMINVLANDLGIGDVPLTVTLVGPIPDPADGTCTVVGTSVRFNPGGSFGAPVDCGYRVTDWDGEWDEAIITVYVNAPPVAVDDAPAAIDEDTVLVIDVLANDNDPDDGLNPASVTIMDAPDYGGIVGINPLTGAVTYQPDPGYHGSDYFTYRVRDLHVPPAPSNIARVDITVSSVNSRPDAQPDSAFTQQDAALSINVLANDSDPDVPPDPITLTVVTDPPSGVAAIDNNGTPLNPADDRILYTPDPGFFGIDTFDYTLDDMTGTPNATDTTTVTVRVNGRPTAVNDTDTTTQDASKVIDVLANDTDPDSPSAGWRVVAVTVPSHGTAVINAGLSVIYTPAQFYQGGDTFGYTMSDGEGGTSSATVNVNVTDADDFPIANDDPGAGPVLQVGEGQTISIDVLANDLGLGDAPFTVRAEPPFFPPPSFPGCGVTGTASVVGSPGPAGGIRVEYAAPPDECAGTVTFDYSVTDVDGDTDTATVTVTVLPVNDPPVAVPDSSSTDEDTSVLIDVAANDTDVETVVDPTTVSIASCPGGASCVSNGDGTVTYTPAVNFFGVATFTYTIQDNQGATSSAGTVTVTVNSINDPPAASNDSATTNQGSPVAIDVLANDSDIDDGLDPASVTIISPPGNGSILSINPLTGIVTYAPNVGPFLQDSFTYQVRDFSGSPSNTATVTITIRKPDLDIVKDALPDSAAPGEGVQFFIYIVNNGPGIAFSATVSDSLGDCFDWVGAPTFGGIGDLSEGGALVLTPSAQVKAAPAPGCNNTNRADVFAANADPASSTVSVMILPPVPPGGMGGMGMSAASAGVGLEVTEIGSSATPTAMLETPTATAEPPTATLEPPTATLEPPTATAELPTATPEPPTATLEPTMIPAATATPESPTPEPALPTLEPTPGAPSPDPMLGPATEPLTAPVAYGLGRRATRVPLWRGGTTVFAASDTYWLVYYLFTLVDQPPVWFQPPNKAFELR